MGSRVSQLVVLALAAYRSGCWYCMAQADHRLRLGGSALWQETFRHALKEKRHCRSPQLLLHFERMNELVSKFVAARPPERDVLALYRVEDHLDGWGLLFREHAKCAEGQGGMQHPYDLKHCRERLLVPGQTLTLSAMLSYSPRPAIWTWRAPAENGRLRWLIVPRSLGDKPPPGRATRRDSRIANSRRIRAHFFYDRTARSFRGEMTETEIVLLPGQCLRVLSLTWDGEYHTCLAEQCS